MKKLFFVFFFLLINVFASKAQEYLYAITMWTTVTTMNQETYSHDTIASCSEVRLIRIDSEGKSFSCELLKDDMLSVSFPQDYTVTDWFPLSEETDSGESIQSGIKMFLRSDIGEHTLYFWYNSDEIELSIDKGDYVIWMSFLKMAQGYGTKEEIEEAIKQWKK